MRGLALVLALAAPTFALGAGGHDKISCTGCHSMHAAKGELLAALPPNVKLQDYKTGKAHQRLTMLCLSCHADPADGGKGIASTSNHLGHPFSRATVNPRLAKVPEELLRDGHFECVSCHDPHPSNPNYRYLRVSTDKTPGMTEFCGICHPRKADPDAVPPRLFSSMDETAPRPPPKGGAR